MDVAKSLANDFIKSKFLGIDQANDIVGDYISKLNVEKDPTNAFAWFSRYQIMCKSNRIEEATEALHRALDIEPNLLIYLF